MLDVWRIPFPGMHRLTEKLGENSRGSSKGAFFLGMAFALAFCPYSGVLYFAILIPLTISTSGGLYLPLLYALATGLPVVLFAWMLAFAIGNVGNWYRRIQSFENVFRKVVAVVFLLIGSYLTVTWLIL
jgi:threonine/homoserine/homoserine lactone efflux protein